MSAESTSAAEIDLAADFTTPTEGDWEKEVLKVLNRRRPEGKELTIEQAYKRLTSHTVDGITIKPLYTAEDGVDELGFPGIAPFTRGTTVRSGEMDAWEVCPLFEDNDAKATRDAVMTDLERGATALWLRVDPDAIAADDLASVLEEVLLDLAPIHVSSRTDQLGAATALVAVLDADVADNKTIRGSLGIDPIGFAALHGTTPDLSVLAEAVEIARPFPGIRPIVIDAGIYHNAGAGDVNELAYAMGTGVEYVRALVDAGISVDDAFGAILFRVSATTDQFLTIARLRALRALWSRIGEVLEVSELKRGAIQHAVTSLREITRDDAYVNVLRATISAFAASAGGAETQTVLPLDSVIGLPNVLSRRIARNIQILLAEESNVGRVNDPAGGSWYVESLTRQLTENAWELFGTLDEKGFAAAVADGTVAAQLADINEARRKLLATRKMPITGVSMFPDHSEKLPERKPRPEAPEMGGLVPVRDASIFEELRDRSEAARAAGNAPKVLLACLGARRDFGGREGFTSNLYHVGGIDTVLAEGKTPEDFARQLTDSGSTIAVLCSSAKLYAKQGMDVARALKDAGATEVRLAGQLKELGAEDTDGLIAGTVFDGMDVVDLLTTTLDKLEA